MVKLMILSAVHGITGGRRDIYRFFCERVRNITDKFGVEMLVVGSEGEESEKITTSYGHHYIEYPNKPVSNKWNKGMLAVKEHNPTHVMILGSDDFVSDKLIEDYLTIAGRRSSGIFGIKDSYYLGLNEQDRSFSKCGYWGGYPTGKIIGYARVFTNEVLSCVGWQPWEEGLNRGLDFSVDRVMEQNEVITRNVAYSILTKRWFHIDIKTKGNISSMKPLKLVSADYTKLLKTHLPLEADAMIDYINNFIKGVKSVW